MKALFAAAVLAVSMAAVSAVPAVSASSSSRNDSLLALRSKAVAAGAVRVIVELKAEAGFAAPEGASGEAEAAAIQRLRAAQTSVVAGVLGAGVDATYMSYVPMFAVDATDDQIGRLAADPRVKRVVEDRVDAPTLAQSLEIIGMFGASGAYARSADGRGRAIAILDTGVNKNNEFLKGKVVAEACFSTTSAANMSTSLCGGASGPGVNKGLDCPATIFGCGHGTHVAGIAAGRNTGPSTGEPPHGVARAAAIVAVKVFSRFSKSSPNCGETDCALTYTSDQLKALEYVYALKGVVAGRKIDAINMSLGGGQHTGFCDDDVRKPIIDKLRAAGIATVIASGNEGFVDSVAAPACVRTAITVGASTKSTAADPERMASYTNQGPQVDVLATGGDFNYPSASFETMILSSMFNGYKGLAGTSMAAPHVAGAIAAIRSRPACSRKTVAQIEAALAGSGPLITDHRPGGGLKERRMDVPATMKRLGC